MHVWFLKIVFGRDWYICLCMCLPSRILIITVQGKYLVNHANGEEKFGKKATVSVHAKNSFGVPVNIGGENFGK